MEAWLQPLGMALATFGSIMTSTWFLQSWLNRQFGDTRRLVYEKTDQLTKMFSDKLEYHEKHDDQRFTDINNNIWMLRLRTAAFDPRINIKDDPCLEKPNPYVLKNETFSVN